MAAQPTKVYIEYERGAEGFTSTWVKARMLTDDSDGTLRFESVILWNQMTCEFKPDTVCRFTIIKIAEPHTFISHYLGGIITGETKTGMPGSIVNFPIIQLEQPEAEGWPLVRIRGAGKPERKQTRAVAQRITAMLTDHGYTGPLPDLSDDSMWRVPRAQKVISCSLVVLGVVVTAAALIGIYLIRFR
ncbi:MAG: hypothetical protein JXJ17_10790 [Anaerolineae bacterium]|nr:hypothetical protein [Anaerolineae bacterium]